MGSNTAYPYTSSPMHGLTPVTIGLAFFLFVNLFPASPVSFMKMDMPAGEEKVPVFSETACIGAVSACYCNYHVLKCNLNILICKKAGQIDLFLVSLLFVAWGIASIRMYGKGKEE